MADTSNGPRVHVTSADAVRARSAFSPVSGASRDRPLSSVSSVKGVGANAPPPTDTRAVHAGDGFSSADTRGLTSVPYSLWTSTRALAEIAACRAQRHLVLREDRRHGEDVVEAGQVARR